MFGVESDAVDTATEILRPYEDLLPIQVEGHEVKLPDNNSLWRGLQFWGLMTGEILIDFSLFCIAGTCKNCKCRIQRPEDERPISVLACQTNVKPGMKIVRLPKGFRYHKKRW
jgi:hypothetical protein